MIKLESTFKLKRFKTPRDKGFLEAIKIYEKYFDARSMTDTNEIVYWLEEDYSKYGDNFFCLCLFKDDIVIGYAQLAYFSGEKLIIIDYISIDEAYRRNDAFHVFIYKIKEFIEQEKLSYNYAIAEIVHLSQNGEPSEYSKYLIRLLKLCGFGVVKAQYFQPRLGINNSESDINAILMLKNNSDIETIDSIKVETFTNIIKTIYFKHYARWYSIYPDSEKKYNEILENDFNKIVEIVKRKTTIKINGYKHLFENNIVDEKSQENILKFTIISISFIVLISILMIVIYKITNIEFQSFVFFYLILLITYFAFLSLFHKRAYKIFTALVSFVRQSFVKSK